MRKYINLLVLIFFVLINASAQELPTKDGSSILIRWSDYQVPLIQLKNYNVYLNTNYFCFEPNFKSTSQILNIGTNQFYILSNLNFGITYSLSVSAVKQFGTNAPQETELSNGIVYTVPSTNNYVEIQQTENTFTIKYVVGPASVITDKDTIRDSVSLK